MLPLRVTGSQELGRGEKEDREETGLAEGVMDEHSSLSWDVEPTRSQRVYEDSRTMVETRAPLIAPSSRKASSWVDGRSSLDERAQPPLPSLPFR